MYVKDTKNDVKPSLYSICSLGSPGWRLMFKTSVSHTPDTDSPTSYKKDKMIHNDKMN